MMFPEGYRYFPCRGKRPMQKGWQANACRDPAQLEAMEELAEDGTIQVGALPEPGYAVIDIDPRHGGDESWVALEERLGALPSRRANTPSGGWHIYVRVPGGAELRTSAGSLAAGIDIRGAGTGYVIAPPSIDERGAWAWVDAEAEITELPSAWIEELRERGCIVGERVGGRSAPRGPSAFAAVPLSRDDLRELVDDKRVSKDLRRGLKCLLVGQDYAGAGSIHDTQRSLCWALAARFRDASPEAIADFFNESHRKMGDREGWDEEAEREKVIRSLEGARVKIREQEEAHAQEEDERQRVACRRAWAAMGIEGEEAPYSPEQIEAWMTRFGMSYVEFVKSLILVCPQSDALYVFAGGSYFGPMRKAASLEQVKLLLAPAEAAGLVTWKKPGASGELVRKSLGDIEHDYSALVSEVVYDWDRQEDHYDQRTMTLYVASARRRKITPQKRPECEEFLRSICKTERGHARLVRWLANAPHLDRQLPILYAWGAAGAGKSTLAKAVAHLWEGDADRDASRIIGRFNVDLVKSPVLIADEGLPEVWAGERGMNALRAFVAAGTHKVERKFGATSQLRGHVRMIVTGNSMNAFACDERRRVEESDREAIETRAVAVEICKPGEDSALFAVESCAASEKCHAYAAFVHALAEHILWLSEQQEIAIHKGRFGLDDLPPDPDAPKLSEDHSAIEGAAEWIAKYVVGYQPSRTDIELADGAVVVMKGRLRVAASAFSAQERWGLFVASPKVPKARRLSVALQSLAGRDKPRVRWISANGHKVQGYEIDLDKLAAHAAKIDISIDEILEGLSDMHKRQEAQRKVTG